MKFWSDVDGGRWLAEFELVSGALAYGDTKEEAISKARQIAHCVIAENSLEPSFQLSLALMTQKFIRLISPKHCVRCFESRTKMLVLPWEVKPTRVF